MVLQANAKGNDNGNPREQLARCPSGHQAEFTSYENSPMNEKELYRQERGVYFILGVKAPRFKNSQSTLGERNHATHFPLSSHLLGEA